MIKKGRTEWSRSIVTAGLAALLLVGGLAPAVYSQQRRRPAPLKTVSVYGQGYQKGYADGFAQGMRDWTQGVPRDWQASDGFARRESSYNPRLSSSQEYTQGYQLGFEMGHTDGYYGRARNAAVPSNALVLAKAAALADAQRAREQEPTRDYPRDGERSRRVSGPIDVPEDTELRIQLTTPIDTKTNRVGDTFSAKVIMPAAYEGATVDGHVANINRSGRVSGKTELSLDFDSITLPDGRRSPLKADLVRVIESESVKKVDEEGQVESGSRTKDSTVRGGVGATAGAILGGIAGGAKGAILGAIIGGAAGVGTVYVEGNKDLILDRGTEMVIRTAGRSRR